MHKFKKQTIFKKQIILSDNNSDKKKKKNINLITYDNSPDLIDAVKNLFNDNIYEVMIIRIDQLDSKIYASENNIILFQPIYLTHDIYLKFNNKIFCIWIWNFDFFERNIIYINRYFNEIYTFEKKYFEMIKNILNIKVILNDNINMHCKQDILPIELIEKSSYLFIPRDAGFLSVFNFYIGSLYTSNMHIYPYLNKDALLHFNNITKICHYSYFDENYNNIWFKFFDPVVFYENDTTHQLTNRLEQIDIKKLNLKYTQAIDSNINAGDEFRIPNKTRELFMGDNNNFKQWRYNVNSIYKKYIRLNNNIILEIDNIFKKYENNTIISVHYRHPSACCESGFIYLRNYFKEIDKLLEKYKNSKIFLATDSDFVIAAFEFKYKDIIFYNTDISRTDIDNVLEWAYSLTMGNMDNIGLVNGNGFQIQHVSSKNNKDIGHDIIIDLFCLTKGDFFIGAQSNITLAVSYINPDLEFVFIKPEIF